MEAYTKTTPPLHQSSKLCCTRTPSNSILFNPSKMMHEAGLDRLSFSLPKASASVSEEKELTFDLSYYLSISG